MNSYITDFYARPLAGQNAEKISAVLRVVNIVIALLIYSALSTNAITNSTGLIGYTVLLLGYLYAEARSLWKREPHFFWTNPVILASIFTFVLAFGLTNVLYFMPEDLVDLVGVEPTATTWMNQLMLLVVLAACAMWIGYSSGLGRSLGRMLQGPVLRKWIRISAQVNRPALFAFLAISVIARLWAINLGVYGYSSSYDQLIAAATYREYLSMAESLGTLALASLAIGCFASARSTLSNRFVLSLMLSYEVVFGFLSGFKSAVVMPFIIVGMAYYTQRNRFPRWLVPAVLGAVIGGYAMIEPFRVARNTDSGFVGTSLDSIVTTMIYGNSVSTEDGTNRAPTGLSLLARSNLTYVASLGIEYSAVNEDLPEGSPQFLGNIILAPVHALVPRLLWPSKPLQNIGLWYTNQVVGVELVTSTGMSPITYLNFAGGPWAVILGFFIVGLLQRGLFDGLRQLGGGGLMILFGLLGTLSNIDSAFNTFLIGIIRLLPILVVAQYVLLRPVSRNRVGRLTT